MSSTTLEKDAPANRGNVERAPAASPLAPTPAPAAKAKSPSRWKRPALVVGGIVAAVAAAFYAYDALTHEETDDAYVTGHLHDIAPRITETVTSVRVDDNQRVTKGQILATLDPSQYLALGEVARANLTKAEADLAREQPLLALHAYSQQDIDAARSTRDSDLAQAKLAALQVEYATIRSPADGYIGRKNVEIGNRVSAGQTLMVVVEPGVCVVGNFKETQLARMHVGQPVRITIDSIPGKVFSGRVDSFAPATGNEFALLPADNSTGNFTKVVQRIPVKIVFNRDSIRGYEGRIRAGESAVVKVALTQLASPPAR